MILSRRTFLVGSGLTLVPLAGFPALATPLAQPLAEPLATGELWGMPYVARGAQGITGPSRPLRRRAPARNFEMA